jgi:hypothetical protein
LLASSGEKVFAATKDIPLQCVRELGVGVEKREQLNKSRIVLSYRDLSPPGLFSMCAKRVRKWCEYTVGKDIRKAINGRDSRFLITLHRTVVSLQACKSEATDAVTHAWIFLLMSTGSCADEGFC